MKKTAFMVAAALLVQGCAYAISADLAKKADKNIPIDQLETDPYRYKGRLVILGGTIAKTINTNQATLIEVLHKPLDNWGKPMTKQSGARFIVLHTGRLNPLLYGPGRDITVAAVVEGTRRKGLGEPEDSYPVVLAKELKLWPGERPSWSKPQYLDPLYDPYTSPRQY